VREKANRERKRTTEREGVCEREWQTTTGKENGLKRMVSFIPSASILQCGFECVCVREREREKTREREKRERERGRESGREK